VAVLPVEATALAEEASAAAVALVAAGKIEHEFHE